MFVKGFEIPRDNSYDIRLHQTPDLCLQLSCQFTDFCFRFFPFGDLNFEVLYVYQCSS